VDMSISTDVGYTVIRHYTKHYIEDIPMV
jgi:hypothetical protein